MTPEEATALIAGRLVRKYLRTPGVITVTQAWARLTAEDRRTANVLAAQNDHLGLARIIQGGRTMEANARASERAAQIIADGNIDIDSELDEIV